MKKITLVLLAIVGMLSIQSPATAQPPTKLCIPTSAANTNCVVIWSGNPLPVSASVSASISGFTAATTGTPISVSNVSAAGNLPAGAVVVATNVGSTAAFCALGATATTSSQYIPPGGGWFQFTVGASTQLACITSSGTTTVNMTGGAGLPTGTGGGGGAGGGGGTSSSYGAAFPATGTAAGFTDGTNMVAARVGAIANQAAATNMLQVASGGRYDAALPTLTDTRFNQLQLDVNGRLYVTGSGGTFPATQSGNWSTRTQDGSGNALTSATRGAQQALSVQIVDGSGNQITSFGGSGGTASNFGSAFPSAGTAAGFTDGTNMVAARVGAIANLTAATNFLMVAPGCRYDASLPTLTDTRFNQCQVDVNGRQWVTDPGVGGTGDSAASVGGTGSLSAKLRLMTSQLDTLTSSVQGSIPAGTNLIGFVNLASATTGGCTPAKTLSAASTNATNVKASAGTLCSMNIINTTTTLYYLKFYNTSSSPTCNSDTVIATFPVPYGASNAGGGIAINLGPFGYAFGTGISFCLTGGIADNDNTSAATGVAISYSYK